MTAVEPTAQSTAVRANTYELVEFLHDVLKVDALQWAEFPHKVGLHNSCGTLRSLRTAKMSEIDEPFFSKPLSLLKKVKGIEFVTPARLDECCGFGGTFCVTEEPSQRGWAMTRFAITSRLAPNTSYPLIRRA
jgi:L-lactate dehydrogenase complex protein LldE